MKVRNTTNVTLGLPNAKPVVAGGTTDISDAVAQNRIVAAWLGKGMLVVEDGKAEPQSDSEQEPDDGGMNKDAIIAELAEYGVVRNKRTSQANLEALLEEVRAEQSEGEAE